MSLTSRFTRSDAPRRVTRSRAIQRCGAGLMGVAIAAATLTATSAPATAEPLIPANLLGDKHLASYPAPPSSARDADVASSDC